MDPSSTDPNNEQSSSANKSGGQPDLSSTTLTTTPEDTATPVNAFNPPPDNNSVWTPPSETTPIDTNSFPPTATTSSLDNPFNVPTQPPTIDGGLPPAPASTMSNIQTSNSQLTSPVIQPETPSWQLPTASIATPDSILDQPTTTLNPQDIYTASQPPTAPTSPSEQAPTDLSHLIPDSPVNTQPEQPVYIPPVTQPETLIVPPDGNEVGPSIPTTEEGHSKIPKWVIGVGIGLLLAVAGATAYFIWPGFGNTANVTPTTDQPAVIESTPQTPIAAPTATPTPALDGSLPDGSNSGFGSVDGSTTATPTPPTSAADLLRQRQQQGQ